MQNQKSPTKIKYNRLTWQTKGTKNCVYQNKTKSKTEAKSQLVYKAMKI